LKPTLFLLIIILNFAASAASTAPVATKKASIKTAKVDPRLSTDIKFDGKLVGGRVQAPLESLTVVENEKGIDDLIGVRMDFKDRSAKAKGLR
jgi:hypothetical protein